MYGGAAGIVIRYAVGLDPNDDDRWTFQAAQPITERPFWMSLLLVDGYNVINALPQYRDLAASSLEEARVKLIEDLIAFRALKGGRIAVVFDAAKVNNPQPAAETVEGVEVVFTRSGETADAAIERMVFAQEVSITVVTADYLSQKVIFGKGLRMTPQELAAAIAAAKEEAYQSLPERARLALEDRIDREVRETMRRLVLGEKPQ